MATEGVEPVNGTGPVSDEQLLTELANLGETKPTVEKVEAAPAKEAPTEEVEAKPDEEAPEEPAEDEEPDAETDKRFAPVRKYEQRVRAQLDEREKSIAAREEKHSSDIKALQDFQALAKRARYDLPAVLKALGVDEGMYEEASLQLYAASEKGKADPKYKAHVERSARERAQADEIAELRKRLDDQDKAKQEAAQRDEQQKHVTKYVDGIAKAATAKTAPVTMGLLQKRPEKTRRDLLRVAGELYGETGEQPTAVQVLKAYEAELAELGLAAPAATAKKPAPVAAKPDKPTGVRVTDEEILKEIASGNLS